MDSPQPNDRVQTRQLPHQFFRVILIPEIDSAQLSERQIPNQFSAFLPISVIEHPCFVVQLVPCNVCNIRKDPVPRHCFLVGDLLPVQNKHYILSHNGRQRKVPGRIHFHVHNDDAVLHSARYLATQLCNFFTRHTHGVLGHFAGRNRIDSGLFVPDYDSFDKRPQIILVIPDSRKIIIHSKHALRRQDAGLHIDGIKAEINDPTAVFGAVLCKCECRCARPGPSSCRGE